MWKNFVVFPVFLFSCSKPDKPSDMVPEKEKCKETEKLEADDRRLGGLDKRGSADKGEIEGWLTPEVLTADFNNDRKPDTVFAIVVEGKKGIKIKHGGTNEEFVIGAGNTFGNGGDDFYWVDKWRILDDSSTYQTTFTETGEVLGIERVVLEAVGISLENEEMGGATITWEKDKYVWIHQAD